MKARISQGLLTSAFPAGFGYEKCVRDLGTGTLIGNVQVWAWLRLPAQC
jgi:hypothetical protein